MDRAGKVHAELKATLALEQSPVHESDPIRTWADIAFQRFDPRKDDDARAAEVTRHIVEALREYLG